MLVVKGFDGNLARLNGIYAVKDDNHHKPVYVIETPKNAGPNSSDSAVIYYWDDRDGRENNGWWVAPFVAAEEVWAYNPLASKTPPTTGWRVPWNNKNVHPTVAIEIVTRDHAVAAKVLPENTLKRAMEKANQSESKKPAPEVPKLEPLPKKLPEQKETLIDIQAKLDTIPVLLEDAAQYLDDCKDASVLFTCEVADHIKAEDALANSETVEKAISKAKGHILSTVKFLNEQKERLGRLTLVPVATMMLIKEQCEDALETLKTHKEEICALTTLKNKAVAKARKEEEIRFEQEKEEARKKKMQDVIIFNYSTVEKITALMMYGDELIANTPTKDLESATKLEGVLQGLLGEIRRLLALPEIHKSTVSRVEQLQISELEASIANVSNAATTLRCKETDATEKVAVLVAEQVQKDKEGLFAKICDGDDTMSLEQFSAWVKPLNIPGCTDEQIQTLWKRAMNGSECEDELNEEQFFLQLGAVLYKVCASKLVLTPEIDSETVLTELPEDAPLRVLRGPIIGPEGTLSHVFVEAIGLDLTGYVCVRKGGQHFVRRFGSFFMTVQETVLTDKFELKGFKVMMRIGPGKRFAAVDVPNNNGGLLRIKGYLVEGPSDVGYITFRSSKHSKFLSNENCKDDLFTNNVIDWEKNAEEHERKIMQLVEKKAKNVEDEHKNAREAVDRCEELLKKFLTLYINPEVGPCGPEQLDEVRNFSVHFHELRATFDEALKNAQYAVTGVKIPIIKWAREKGTIPGVENGPLEKLRHLFQQHSHIKELQSQLTRIKTKKLQKTHSVVSDLETKTKAMTQKQVDMLCLEVQCEVPTRKDVLQSAYTGVQDLVSARKTILTLAGTDEERLRVNATLRSRLESAEETKRWCEWKLQDMKDRVRTMKCHVESTQLRKPAEELKKLFKYSREFSNLLSSTNALTESLLNDSVCRGIIEIGGALRKHMAEHSITDRDLFTTICGGKEDSTISILQFIDFIRALAIQISDDLIHRVYEQSALPEGIVFDRFDYVLKSYVRVARPCILTDAEVVGNGMKIRSLNVSETLEALSLHYDSSNEGVIRVKVRCVMDGREGYTTLRGNQGSEFLKPRCGAYKVVKGTVVTDKMAMKDFKLIRRLVPGEVVIGDSLPEEESISQLWRIKGRTIGSEVAHGWITLNGNQGSVFLDDYVFPIVDRVATEYEEVEDEEEDEEQHAACTAAAPMEGIEDV